MSKPAQAETAPKAKAKKTTPCRVCGDPTTRWKSVPVPGARFGQLIPWCGCDIPEQVDASS